jgi:predicted RNA methylase
MQLQNPLSILSDSTQPFSDRRNAANDLAKILYEIAGIDDTSTDSIYDDQTILESGLAVSAKTAARCIIDYERTSKFFQGILQAVESATISFPNSVINILYAGSGPFATLILPLFFKYSPEQIQITIMDIHPQSLDCAKKVIEHFGFGNFITDYLQKDAANYSHPPDNPLHIVIAEVLQKALDKEPQVAVTINLSKQLTAGGIFIPEHITVDFVLLEFGSNPGEYKNIIPIKRLADLSANHPERILNPIKAIIPPLPSRLMPALLTRIQIFESVNIELKNSGLTMSKLLNDLPINEGEEIEFSYRMGKDPGFIYPQS